jgi:DNA-directed RNA polymerase subunit RPC12/RpoP
MDVAEFDDWLSGIVALTPPQRRQAWQTLALSEASEGDDIETGPPRGVDIATSGPAAPPDQPPIFTPLPLAQSLNRFGSDVVADRGQRRVASIGCPHCASRAIVHWGKASALPRYRCKGCQRTFNALTKTPLAGLRKGQMACTGQGHDRRCQPRQGGETMRRRLHYGVSLETAVSGVSGR